MRYVAVIFVALITSLIYVLSKWLVYYATVRGLLYHIAITFGEDKVPNEKKIKDIRDYALNRIVSDITKN